MAATPLYASSRNASAPVVSAVPSAFAFSFYACFFFAGS
jgi:hypothetical protein